MTEIVSHNTRNELTIPQRATRLLTPAVVQAKGRKAETAFWEFFAATIRNRNTRGAYLHAAFRFFDWCESHALSFEDIQPLWVARYIEELTYPTDPDQRPPAAASVKLHLAAIRKLCDYLVVSGVMEFNPAASVAGPKVSQRGEGKTPELSTKEAEQLFAVIPNDSLVGLRDRALLATLLFSWARISAVLGMHVKDFTGDEFHLREKGGLFRKIPAHSEAVPLLRAYIEATGLSDYPDSPLFRGTKGGKGKAPLLLATPLSRQSALRMIKRRCLAAGLPGNICNHSMRATGITAFRENGGALDDAQLIAGHADARTTKSYDRSEKKITQNMLERVHISVLNKS